jgi:hypothetical protein
MDVDDYENLYLFEKYFDQENKDFTIIKKTFSKMLRKDYQINNYSDLKKKLKNVNNR